MLRYRHAGGACATAVSAKREDSMKTARAKADFVV